MDVTLRYTPGNAIDTQVAVNQELVDELINAAHQVNAKLSTSQAYSAIDVLRWPGVMQLGEADVSIAHPAILDLTRTALTELNNVREREGAALADCILQRVTDIEQQIVQLAPLVDKVVLGQRQRLQDKVSELEIELDSGRLEQEIALLAQRVDIAE